MKLSKFGLYALFSFAALSLAGCGGNSSSTSASSSPSNTSSSIADTSSSLPSSSIEDTSSSAEEEATLVYQFTGYNDEMMEYGFAYSYYINFYSDNNIVGYGYSVYSLDTSDWKTNSNINQWFSGRWAITTDEEDQEAIRAVVNIDYNDIVSKDEYYIYFSSDGVTPLSISDFKIPIGLTGRKVTMTYNSDPYTDNNAFIEDTVYKFEEPDSEKVSAIFVEDSSKDRLYLFSDNTGYNYGAALNEDSSVKGYYPKGSISWSYSTTDGLAVTISGTSHTATIDGNAATIAFETSVMGYSFSYSYTCSDISKAIQSESGEKEEEGPTYEAGSLYFTYTYIPSYNLSATFYASYTTWTTGLGLSSPTDSFTPVENDETELFGFSCDDSEGATFILKKNGTFAFHKAVTDTIVMDYTGTFVYSPYTLTFTTTNSGDTTIDTISTSIAH